jgi:hypothetical protein
LALVGVNMLLLLASGYILAYGGVIFLGFGGARLDQRYCAELFQNGGRGRRVPDDDGSYRRRRQDLP